MHIQDVIKQKDYERILFHLHRHWLTFVPIVLLFLILLVVPALVYVLFERVVPAWLENELFYTVAVLAASVYYLSVYLFFYVQFIDYYLDTWIVTNDRIIDIEQHGLFDREVTELDLYRIQDVTANVSGVFGTLFRFGDLFVKTASSNSNIIFRNIPRPNRIREQLVRLADEDRSYHFKEAAAEEAFPKTP